MKRITFALALCSFATLAAGCGHAAIATDASAPKAPTAAMRNQPAAEETPIALKDPENAALARKAGDFVVFRYTGSFRKAPLTLTERIVAKEGSVLVIDFTLAEGKKEETLRVRMDFTPGGRGEIFDIARMEKGVEKASSKDAYDAMMAKTIVVADANEEDLGTETMNVTVGGQQIAATKTSYRVLVGKSIATMSITHADGFSWGDLGGEIKAKDGALLYRAELVEVGNSDVGAETVMAKKD
jgi:hypothetical protein